MKKLLMLGVALGTLMFTSSMLADGAEVYAQKCKMCHGADGKGHTKIGAKNHIKDLTDGAYQKTFSDAEAIKVLTEGMVVDGVKKMNPFNEKLSADQIKDVVAYVRTLSK
jgi:mono/diheme cytochrome c family protein